MAGTNTNVRLKMEEEKKEKYVVAVPSKLRNVKVGDTITFNSDSDTFKVIFKGRWLFEGKKHVVRNNKPLTFARKGPFTFLCYIGNRGKPKLSPTCGASRGRITWTSYKGAGGTGSVRPPGK